jgi:DNA-binding beta-propeller fold protein YncE
VGTTDSHDWVFFIAASIRFRSLIADGCFCIRGDEASTGHANEHRRMTAPGADDLTTPSTPEGKLPDWHQRPSTPRTSVDFRSIRQSAGPFHYPTNIALCPAGEIYVSDGYGNARIHKFSPDGKLLVSWGAPGGGPGEFRIPHGIAVDREGIIYVADRENSRIQLFSPAGEFLRQWADIARPCEVAIDPEGNVFIAELGYRAGMWPGTEPPHVGATGGRVSIFDQSGKLQAQFGGGEQPCDAGDFFAPHDIWLDSRGDFYVSEVIWSAAGGKKPAVGAYHPLQKFERL